MSNKKRHIILVILTEFIRMKHVSQWSGISFGGFIIGMSSLDLSTYLVPLLVFFVSTFCIMSFTFAINNYYDADSDRENPRRRHYNAIASGKISKKTGIFIIILFLIIPLFVTLLFKLEVFLFCILFLIWMWIYSSPPLRLKGRPGIDVIWHFFAFISIIIWGSLIAGSIGLTSWLAAISVGIFSCIGQIENHISDYSFDKQTGTMTYAVWAGLNKTKKILVIFTVLHLVFLIPLILLYTLSYIITILLVVGIVVVGYLMINIKIKKGTFPKERFFVYYSAAIIGGAIYLSVLIYHILFISGEPTLSLLNFIGIP